MFFLPRSYSAVLRFPENLHVVVFLALRIEFYPYPNLLEGRIEHVGPMAWRFHPAREHISMRMASLHTPTTRP